MSNSSSEPRPNASTTFQLNLGGRIALSAFALALAACVVHGDYASIPALLFLALITLIAFGVKAPASDSADATLDLAPETTANVFAALGHPARVEIVRILARGNASVAHLQESGDFGTSGQLYHHLKILTEAGFLTRSKRGQWAYYRLVPGALDSLSRLLVTI